MPCTYIVGEGGTCTIQINRSSYKYLYPAGMANGLIRYVISTTTASCILYLCF